MGLRGAELVEHQDLRLGVRREDRLLRHVRVRPEGRLDLHQQIGEVDVETRDALRHDQLREDRAGEVRLAPSRRADEQEARFDRRIGVDELPRTRPRIRQAHRVVGEVVERAVPIALRDSGRLEPRPPDGRAPARRRGARSCGPRTTRGPSPCRRRARTSRWNRFGQLASSRPTLELSVLRQPGLDRDPPAARAPRGTSSGPRGSTSQPARPLRGTGRRRDPRPARPARPSRGSRPRAPRTSARDECPERASPTAGS